VGDLTHLNEEGMSTAEKAAFPNKYSEADDERIAER
jgi:hypothetical protein